MLDMPFTVILFHANLLRLYTEMFIENCAHFCNRYNAGKELNDKELTLKEVSNVTLENLKELLGTNKKQLTD